MTEEIGNSELLRTWANDGAVVVPSNAKIDEGWLRGEQPPHEWMNYIHNVLGQKINHALSRGAADWNSGTEYLAGAIVNRNGSIWRALATNTDSAPADSNSNWVRLVEVGTESVRAAYGGTADAVALTTGGKISGTVPTGLQVRFRASSANTGGATIALDGGAAIACRTVAGVVLPAGYIRTNADTVATYDGTFWVLDRQTERGSNANGTFTRFADGLMIVRGPTPPARVEGATGNIFRSDNVSVEYPAEFVDSGVSVGVTTNGITRWANATETSETGFVLRVFSSISTSSEFTGRYIGSGYWY